MNTTDKAIKTTLNERTICHYPRVLRVVQRVFSFLFRLRGWTFDDQLPRSKKYVMVVAPHTSNWDFFLMVSMGAALKRQVRFMGKHSIFIGPLATLLRWLGGIPVERNSHHNFVEQMVQQFADCDDMVLVIAPEGTRSKVDTWKGGFYHIAAGAKVPVVAVALDYGRRRVGIVAEVLPSGDLHADMAAIARTFQGVTACHPQLDGFPRDERLVKP